MADSQLLVSIIIPIFNTEKYLERCIMSLVSQTYKRLEIILVDDGSNDGSLAISEKYVSEDSRVRLLKQSNRGASAARNAGLDVAQGDYIMFVDSDDWIDTNMVESLIADITQNHAEIIISKVPGDKHVLEEDKAINHISAIGLVTKGAWWGPVGKLFKNSAIRGHRFPKATISEDYVFMVKVLSSAKTVFYKNQCFYHREIRKGSLSRLSLSERKFEEFDNVSYVADFIRKNYPQYRQLAEARMAETSLKLLFAIHESKQQSDFSNQRKMLNTSIRNNITKYLPNHNILLKSRLLLLMCTTSWGSKLAHCFYSKYN